MEQFDAIVVGAGLSGLGCAYTLAGAGKEVLVLERGAYPGAKNVTGGRIYVNPLRELFPEIWESAPLERHIVHEGFTLLAEEGSLACRFDGTEFHQAPYQSYSVLRAKFDQWLAERAEEKGAMILANTCVDDLRRENGRIAGVMAGGEELAAPVVIACDGALSLTAERAGLRTAGAPHAYAVGVKQVFKLNAEAINDRFQVEGREGAARLYIGTVTGGRFGGGFLYTNLESISLGLVIGIADLLDPAGRLEVPALLDAFVHHREVAPLLAGAEAVEYAAHVLPEGGFHAVGNLYGDGILVAGDAAGFAVNAGFTVRGMEYALASGYWAAQAVLQAAAAGAYTADTLSVYRRYLEQSFVLQDLKNFRDTPEVLANPRLFGRYPELIARILRDVYRVPAGPKERLRSLLKEHVRPGELWKMAGDAVRMRKL